MKSGAAATALAGAPIFHAMPAEFIEALGRTAEPVNYQAGDVIFHFGDAGDRMFVITNGSVRISLPSEVGRDVILADLQPGDSFGEIALLDGRGRSAAAVALTATSAIVVARRDILKVLAQSQEALLNVVDLLCRRVREADERMAEIAFMPLETRLARALLKHAVPIDRDGRSRVALSQNELAQMIVSSREAVNRQLGKWQRQRVLDVAPDGIELLRGDVLARTGRDWGE